MDGQNRGELQPFMDTRVVEQDVRDERQEDVIRGGSHNHKIVSEHQSSFSNAITSNQYPYELETSPPSVSPPLASSDPGPTNSASPVDTTPDLDVSAQNAEEDAGLRVLKDLMEKIRLEKQRLQRIQELEELEEQTKRQILVAQTRGSEDGKSSDQGGTAKYFR